MLCFGFKILFGYISGYPISQVKNEKSRAALITHGISIRGLNVTVLSKTYPYLVDNQESVKLIVGNIYKYR